MNSICNSTYFIECTLVPIETMQLHEKKTESISCCEHGTNPAFDFIIIELKANLNTLRVSNRRENIPEN